MEFDAVGTDLGSISEKNAQNLLKPCTARQRFQGGGGAAALVGAVERRWPEWLETLPRERKIRRIRRRYSADFKRSASASGSSFGDD